MCENAKEQTAKFHTKKIKNQNNKILPKRMMAIERKL